jgi:hypothetical protein
MYLPINVLHLPDLDYNHAFYLCLELAMIRPNFSRQTHLSSGLIQGTLIRLALAHRFR